MMELMKHLVIMHIMFTWCQYLPWGGEGGIYANKLNWVVLMLLQECRNASTLEKILWKIIEQKKYTFNLIFMYRRRTFLSLFLYIKEKKKIYYSRIYFVILQHSGYYLLLFVSEHHKNLKKSSKFVRDAEYKVEYER